MARLAVIADVHANALALQAVLAAIHDAGVDSVVCLGDIVGYNAEPARSVDLVRARADVIVAGNHDRDTMRDAPIAGTTSHARFAQEWTRGQLDADALDFLAGLPNLHVAADEYAAAHACYLNDHYFTGYVTSTMLERNLQTVRARPDLPVLAFCGHTHVPMCAYLDRECAVEMPVAADTEVTWPAEAPAVLLNPGSVGQPRDGDPRAGFAIVDSARRSALFSRVPYDVDTAARRVVDAGLPAVLAERLRVGR